MTAALVTGAARRLGRELALELAKQGHDVAVHYSSSEDAAEQTANNIRALGRKAITVQADLLSESETQTLVDRAAKGLGAPLTCLVNNASIFEYDTIDTATRETWDRHLESNLRAPFVLMQNFAAQSPAPEPDENGEIYARGLVVNMIDQRVRKLTPEFTTYTIAKAALWTLTQTAAQALAPNIRVNAIGPGPTLQGGRQDADKFTRQREATLLNRGANPDDIRGALGYFLHSRAVTGQLLCIDGGQHLAWETPDVVGVE
ncbi:SDR family oxidoreductase [Donghicola sp.]|jgi:NAD(P)-dependent dehydrogenase (short-subunit alcohol dehydrogenase family)|uniref:SDR family oxidoreductase n=1 Tax=Donghicola sp. TaxID=1929294 RepID=UPI0025CBE3D4|nr:SDR family oxidoreductase [Donghicola sp.]MCT4579324.1 SDR family oxidoreductase [Donghicola sp.]